MIWEAFEGILSITSENKNNKLLHSSGVFLINKLLQAHMKLLYSSLSTASKDSLVQSAFKLMTYMIAQDKQLLRDFALTFDFSLKGFRAAANRRNRKVWKACHHKFLNLVAFIEFYKFYFMLTSLKLLVVILLQAPKCTALWTTSYMDCQHRQKFCSFEE